MTAALKSRHSKSILYPEDMNVLSEALHRACLQRGISPDAIEATDLAIDLLNYFQAGSTSADALVSLVANKHQAA